MSQELDSESYLRTNLVQALRKEEIQRLCKGEPSDFTQIANLLSQWLVWSMVASLPLWLFVRIELTAWQAIGAGVVFLGLLTVFAGATKRFGTAVLIIVGLWIGTGVASYVEAGIGGAAATHLLPFVLIAVGIWMWSALTMASAIPYLLPVAFVIVFLPLLTEDLWQIGDAIGLQMLAVAAVALGPLLLFLIVRYLKVNVAHQFREALDDVKNGNRKDELLNAIRDGSKENSDRVPDDIWLWGRVVDLYRDPAAEDMARQMAEELNVTFRGQTILRLSRLALGTCALFFVFVYSLAWAAVPASISGRWIGHKVDMTTIEFASWSLSMPVAPYVWVAILLSIVATAAFLAFALTEDRYATVLSDVLVKKPAERCVMLGIPYQVLYGSKRSGT